MLAAFREEAKVRSSGMGKDEENRGKPLAKFK